MHDFLFFVSIVSFVVEQLLQDVLSPNIFQNKPKVLKPAAANHPERVN